MDIAQSLVRVIVRSFFSVKHTLIIDALIIHSVLTTDDLAFLLGQQSKDVRRLLHPLKNARLLSTQSRQETRDGSQKAISREYYYMPLHPAIDAIKYKVWKLQNKVSELYRPNEERKEWKCTRCGSEWTELEVLDSVGMNGFECHRCGGILDRAANGAGDTAAMAGHEKQALLHKQIEKIVRLMQQIDSQEIPENDFESAWERKKDVPREEGLGTRAKMIPVGKGVGFAKAGTGKVEQTDTNKLEIKLSTGDELNQAEREAAEKKKAALLEQNQLPIWHRESAIGVGGSSVKVEENSANGVIKPDPDNTETKPDINTMDDEMAAVYAEVERERQREAERRALAAQDAAENDEEEDDDDDEDEDDEFEDVPSTTMGTPMPGASTPLPSSSHATATGSSNNNNKRDRGDLESGTSTTVNTPAGTPHDRQSKRPKLEDGAGGASSSNSNSNSNSLATAVKKEDDEDSDEDEEEFEDV